MKKQFIIPKWLSTITLFMFLSTSSIAQWEIQNSGVTVNLKDVCFVDSLYGWVIGDSATILHTYNGGDSWIQQQSPSDTLVFNKIQFLNREIGYIVGSGGLILLTKDGGLNWFKKESGTTLPFRDLSFVNEKKGWVVGSDRMYSIILNTTDGGNTWNSVISSSESPPYILDAIKFVNDSIGFVSGTPHFDNGPTFFLKTTNSGKDWDSTGRAHSSLFYLAPYSDDIIFAGFIGLAYSNNAAKDWNYYDYFFNTIVIDIKAIKGRVVWLLSRVSFSNVDKIYKSIDVGNNWISHLVPFGFSLQAISPINEHLIFAVGNDGTILKLSDHTTSLEDIEKTNSFILHQNYPNPFNPTTNIKFYLPYDDKVVITIYDVLGNRVAIILEEYKSKGYHHAVFNAENLSSGIYIYEIKTKNFKEIKKALFLK